MTFTKEYTEQGEVLMALIDSSLFTQDQIDHLAMGLSLAEQLSDGAVEGRRLVDTTSMADYSGADCNRLYRALTGTVNVPDTDGGYYNQTNNPGRHRALVEVESDDPATVATNLRAIAGALDAGEAGLTHGPQNRKSIVSDPEGACAQGYICWQQRNEIGEGPEEPEEDEA